MDQSQTLGSLSIFMIAGDGATGRRIEWFLKTLITTKPFQVEATVWKNVSLSLLFKTL